MVSKQSNYAAIYDRKAQEVMDTLEVNPKNALKIITKEIDTRGSKILPHELMMLRVIKAVVTERNMRSAEAKQDIFGVLSEIEK